jgi:hypothetical protein
MLRRIAFLLLISATLSSCSYVYDVLAVARDGRLTFIVDPASGKRPSCLRQIEVTAEHPTKAKGEPGDDASRVAYGTFWFESVDYDDACANRFPVSYGDSLSGKRQQDRSFVRSKRLLREVVYEVATTTGATGYGGGRFMIHTNGRVENLPLKGSESKTNNMVESAN